jgi:ADP-heptose:LPS heptosyltransferase
MNPFEQIESWSRRVFVYPLLRGFFRNKPLEHPIDLSRVHRILIFRFDRIGDMLVTLPVLKALKQCAPHVIVSVLGSRANADLARACPAVDEVYVLEESWLRILGQVRMFRRQEPDVVLNFVFNKTTTPAILSNLISPNGLKVGQGPDKYGFYFNRLVKVPRFERHMTEQLAMFVEQSFGVQIAATALETELEIPVEQRREVGEWLQQSGLKRRSESDTMGTPYLVFNISAFESNRTLSQEQASRIAFTLSRNPSIHTVIVFDPSDKALAQLVETRQEFRSCSVFRTFGKRPLIQLASLIAGAMVVITPDTSIIHFASAMKTPTFGIYGEAYKTVEWAPYRVQHRIMKTEGDLPASSLSAEDIENQIALFLKTVLSGERDRA